MDQLREALKVLTFMANDTLCSICLDTLRSPVRSPCGHIFCKFCIDQHFSIMLSDSQSPDTRRKKLCPLCKAHINKRG
jgi:hypothetical protein